MLLKNKCEIENGAIVSNLKRLTNQVYKLLPCREENLDWQKTLESIIIEFYGMSYLIDIGEPLFSLLCKLNGLYDLGEKVDFPIFRKTIFECLNLISEIKDCIKED